MAEARPLSLAAITGTRIILVKYATSYAAAHPFTHPSAIFSNVVPSNRKANALANIRLDATAWYLSKP